MSKLNISFNNTNYAIDESSLVSATTNLQSHLSTVMNGTGATIDLGGVSYSVDSAKLSVATNDFISYLGTIAGNGTKIVVNGVEYSVDATKLSDAISSLQTAFGNLGNAEERLEGDGAEYYTLAPTALSFRSTAPLNELQEVQINGVTVDSANYTLEEGSTIVTFPIDYLKTFDTGNYEVTIASNSKTVKGEFTVKIPELNEFGFYYNQPYTAYVSFFGENESFFIREDGTMDIIGTPSGEVSQATYSVNGDVMTVVSPIAGILTATISSDGKSIYCNELATSFTLGNEFIIADENYLYFYSEYEDGYKVCPIAKNQSYYPPVKTGINGKPTVSFTPYAFSDNAFLLNVPQIPFGMMSFGEGAFSGCINLINVIIPSGINCIEYRMFNNCTNLVSVELPVTVACLNGEAFGDCVNLTEIHYAGTKEEWDTISKYGDGGNGTEKWDYGTGNYTVYCTDGNISKA